MVFPLCSGIAELDGISALSGLHELHLRHNHISDLTPLAMHDNLEVRHAPCVSPRPAPRVAPHRRQRLITRAPCQFLDLSSNRVADVRSLEMLATCPLLRNLSLTQNPVWTLSAYRRVAGSIISQLHLLDGRRLTPEEKAPLVRHRTRAGPA
jgi:Leucine-rich repeat (LRR) protein